MLAQRGDGQRSDKNWSAELAQELEVAGQRGTRRAVASSEVEAANQRRNLVLREVAAAAWQAYFEALAARESEQIASRLEAALTAIAVALRGTSDQGLASGVDADLAQVAALNAQQSRRAAQRRRVVAEVELATMLGVPPERGFSLNVTGELAPLGAGAAESSRPPDDRRPELAILEAKARALPGASHLAPASARAEHHAQRFRAARRLRGARSTASAWRCRCHSPYPVGRTYAGEIAEAEALAQQTKAEAERPGASCVATLRARAPNILRTSRRCRRLQPERLARAEQTLRDTAEQVAAGRIGVRDAIFAQRTLIEFLETNIEARRAVCLASVALARAAGVAIERGGQ